MPTRAMFETNALNPYEGATVALWRRGYEELCGQAPRIVLAEIATHAVLARLCRYAQATALFSAYQTDAAPDLALIGSLLIGDVAARLLWQARDAAYYLRWRELLAEGTGPCSTSPD
jgi:hypothetical protein